MHKLYYDERKRRIKMPKKVEKEPLLFVDTGYLGCFVSEQSYFKTPTEKPNNVSNPDYVHNYASTDFLILISLQFLTMKVLKRSKNYK